MNILDVDDAFSGAQASLEDFEREWATQFFSPLLDIQAGQMLRSLPLDMHKQMQQRNPDVYKRVMEKFVGKKGRYDYGQD